jgi:hypothetical protein
MKKFFVILGIVALFLLKNVEFCYAEIIVMNEAEIQVCIEKIKKYYSNLDDISFSYHSEPLTVEGNLIKQGKSFWTFTKEYNIGHSKAGTITTEAIFYPGIYDDYHGHYLNVIDGIPSVLPDESYLTILSRHSQSEKPLPRIDGYFRFTCLWGRVAFLDKSKIYVPDFLMKLNNLKAVQDADVITITGQKDDISCKFVFNIKYNYAMTEYNFDYVGNNIDKGTILLEYVKLDEFTQHKTMFFPTLLTKNFSVVLSKENSTNPYKNSSKVYFSKFNTDVKKIDHSLKLKTKIPNGNPVEMQDVPQIQYVWMDGKIVPKTDEVALAIARGGHKFIPGPDQPRFWLIALGIIMMLLGGGLKLRDMLKES